MPLESVFGILTLSDSFWKDTPLKVIATLRLTSKGFHTELAMTNDKTSAVIELALLAMIKNRPNDHHGWMLRFSEAKYRFSLKVDEMVMHCATLPTTTTGYYYYNHRRRRIYDASNEHRCKIPFIEAYRLVVGNNNNGMLDAMEQRHQFDMKVKESIRDFLRKFGGGGSSSSSSSDLFRVMESNINDCIRRLLDESSRLFRNHGFSSRISRNRVTVNSLRILGSDVRILRIDMRLFLLATNTNYPDAEAILRDLTQRAQTYVDRYKARSVRCTEASLLLLPVDFLSEI